MEEEAGVLLVERSTRTMRLTPAGEVFLREGISTLKAYDSLMIKTRQSAPLVEGEFSIAYPYYYASSYLSAPLDLFNSKYPHIKVNLTPIQPQEVKGALSGNTADISIDAVCPFQKTISPHLISHEVGSEGFCICVAETNPLAQQPFIEPSDLEGFPLITADGYDPHRNFVDTYLSLAGIQPPATIPCNNVELIYSQVISNNGYAFRMDKSGRRPHGGICYVPLQSNLRAHVHFIARSDNANPAVAHFFGLLLEHF